jgi:hypothetical protein
MVVMIENGSGKPWLVGENTGLGFSAHDGDGGDGPHTARHSRWKRDAGGLKVWVVVENGAGKWWMVDEHSGFGGRGS